MISSIEFTCVDNKHNYITEIVYKNPQLIKNLLHKKFIFAHDKINILF